jgi:hypothetical protein
VIVVQVLYFMLASFLMSLMGVLLIIKPLKAKDYDTIFTKLTISFIGKLLLGVVFLLISWKVIGWGASISAFGMVSAYLVALIMVSVLAMRTAKRG